MKTFYVFKSRIPQCTFYDSKGNLVLFVHHRFETDNQVLAEELRANCVAGNPLMFTDPKELTVQRPANAVPVVPQVVHEQSQAQPNISMRDVSPPPGNVEIKELGTSGNEVAGVGTMLVEQVGQATDDSALAKAIAAASKVPPAAGK